jgi:glycosyltransferase involved in cell wall biosynthesis
MFVLNDMRLDSRVRREAAALAGAGYAVTVYAVMSEATAHLAWEEVDGYTIVRVPMLMRPVGGSGAGTRPHSPGMRRRALSGAFVATRPLLGGTLHYAANWRLRWHRWADRVYSQVMPANVWHAHDFNTLGLAVRCAERYGGHVVYDSHELFTEAGATSALPLSVRALLRRMERAWSQRASAVITVNQSISDVLAGVLERDDIRVVHNCAVPPAEASDHLRRKIGVDDRTPLILYHGSITNGRGIDRLIEAVGMPELGGAHLAVMGYGPLRPRLERQAANAPFANRIHFIPPVSPEVLTAWVAGADVAAMPIEPDTLNHRLSSPNKLFEAIAAGVPVVGPDFPEFRRIVLEGARGPLGRLHADHSPASIARAIGGLLELPSAKRHELRARCEMAARQRWNWSNESTRLLSAYEELRVTGAQAVDQAIRTSRIQADDDPGREPGAVVS